MGGVSCIIAGIVWSLVCVLLTVCRVREEEEEWRKQTECEVWTRELRTEAILAEKDLQIQQVGRMKCSE